LAVHCPMAAGVSGVPRRRRHRRRSLGRQALCSGLGHALAPRGIPTPTECCRTTTPCFR
jgi:hypothetical protein